MRISSTTCATRWPTEFVEVVLQLWSSWDDDAIVMDRERGMFVDPAKVRKIDFKGRFFASRGPLNTARPPQGHPVLVQAGNSPQGQDFAAKRMDAVLCAVSTVEEMKAFRVSMRKKVAAAGRDPDSCKVMYVATPTIGESDDEAWERVPSPAGTPQGSAGARAGADGQPDRHRLFRL